MTGRRGGWRAESHTLDGPSTAWKNARRQKEKAKETENGRDHGLSSFLHSVTGDCAALRGDEASDEGMERIEQGVTRA